MAENSNNRTDQTVKILVLQLKRIGDLILTTPALAALRQHYPGAKITLALEESCQDLLPGIPFVDEAMVFSRKKSNAGLWRRLALGSFDLCLDFTGSDRSAFYSVLSKSRERIAFTWVQKSRFRALFYNRLVDSPVRERHTVDHYLDILKTIGIKSAPAPIALHLPDWACQKAEYLLKAAGVTGDFFAVHPGTARLEKYWAPERWVEIIDFCKQEMNIQCVLTGGNDSFEQSQIDAITSKSNCFDLSGKLDLLTLAALAQKAKLFLSVDSAPMHLAAAFQTPQVALFGPTNPFHWHPRHDNAVLVRAGKPRLDSPMQPREKGASMSEISTQQVIGAILAAYSKPDVAQKKEV